jgi:hypothetical protein
MKLLEIINVSFNITDQLLIIFLHLSDTREKKMELTGTVHQLFINFEKAYKLVRKEVLYNILIEFGVPMKLVLSMAIRSLKCVAQLKYFGMTVTNQDLIMEEIKRRHFGQCFLTIRS